MAERIYGEKKNGRAVLETDAKEKVEEVAAEAEEAKMGLGKKVGLVAGVAALAAVGGTVAAAEGSRRAGQNVANNVSNFVGKVFLMGERPLPKLPESVAVGKDMGPDYL